MENEKIMEQIEIRKQLLNNTDYQALKFIEGAIPDDEYEPIRLQRQTWRDEINEYQKQLGE